MDAAGSVHASDALQVVIARDANTNALPSHSIKCNSSSKATCTNELFDRSPPKRRLAVVHSSDPRHARASARGERCAAARA